MGLKKISFLLSLVFLLFPSLYGNDLKEETIALLSPHFKHFVSKNISFNVVYSQEKEVTPLTEPLQNKSFQKFVKIYSKGRFLRAEVNPYLWNIKTPVGLYQLVQRKILYTLISKILKNKEELEHFSQMRPLLGFEKKGRFLPIAVLQELTPIKVVRAFFKTLFHHHAPFTIKFMNSEERRLISLEEKKSFEKALAIHLERFFLDESYGLRFPAHYQLLSSLLEFAPYPLKQKDLSYKVLLSNEVYPLAEQIKVREISPERVYRVEALLASKTTKHLESLEGHSMFRLVVCRPGRPLGPDCLKDEAYHIVISATAFVDEIKIDPLKGLAGKYKAKLFLFDFLQTMRLYTEGEDRGVLLFPLKFSSFEKELFLKRVLEMQTTYLFSYSFFFYNCTVASWNVVESVLKKSHPFLLKFNPRPYRYVHYLEKMGLVDLDESLVDREISDEDKKILIEKKLYYPERSYIEKNIIEKTFIEDYKKLSFEDKVLKIKELKSKTSETAESKLSSLKKWASLEETAWKLKVLEWSLEHGQESYPSEWEALNKARISLFTYPWDGKLKGGYGIPQKEDIEDSSDNYLLEVKSKALLEKTTNYLNRLEGDSLREMKKWRESQQLDYFLIEA